MWMMGYNDGGDLYMSDSINAAGRKLRPLIPRPLNATTSNVGSAAATISTNRIHGGPDHHLFSLNNASMSEQNKRPGDYNPHQQVVVSSRWNPTPEQLRALEELYRRGTRTPSAEQIQHITAQLRRYGKIEGKNVFYWFQNHKARERQKRRREMESSTDDQSNNRDVEILERKETGASRTVFGVDQQQTKNWIPPINSSTLPEEESAVCLQKAAKGAAGGSECKSSEHHQWMKMDERGRRGGGELESQSLRRNDTWQPMQLSSPAASTHPINTPKPPMDPKHLLNYTKTPFLLSSSSPPPPPLHSYYNNITSDEVDEEHDLNHYNFRHHFIINNRIVNGDQDEDEDDDNSQTLELFPLRSGEFGHDKDSEMSLGAINNGFNTPYQFFEFLPMKN